MDGETVRTETSVDGRTHGFEAANDEVATTTNPFHWMTGIGLYSIFAWLYDYPLYSFVIWFSGPLLGGLFMTLLTIPVDLWCLKFYDSTKIDWLALEKVKSLKSYQGSSIFKNFLRFILTRTPMAVQIAVLSTKFNAFLITAFLRDGSFQSNGLSRRDWSIFWLSFLTSQIYWVLVISAGVFGGKEIFKFLS